MRIWQYIVGCRRETSSETISAEPRSKAGRTSTTAEYGSASQSTLRRLVVFAGHKFSTPRGYAYPQEFSRKLADPTNSLRKIVLVLVGLERQDHLAFSPDDAPHLHPTTPMVGCTF